MKQTEFLSLGIRDFLRGLLMAVLTPAFTTAYDSIQRGELVFNWKLILASAVGGAFAYLAKNFFTPKDKPGASADDIGGGGIKNPPPPPKD